MGWKAACIVTGDCVDGYLGELPKHHPEKVDEILEKLGFVGYASRAEATLDVYPDEQTLLLGVYDKAIFIADQEIIFECMDDLEQHPFFQKVLAIYPTGRLLMFTLHSGNNVFGYAYYENGSLTRHLAGSLDSGVTADFGELQPEEQPIFAKSKMVNGERVFTQEVSGFHFEGRIDQIGGRLVFEMASKFFGQPLDTARRASNLNGLKMELINKNEIRPS